MKPARKPAIDFARGVTPGLLLLLLGAGLILAGGCARRPALRTAGPASLAGPAAHASAPSGSLAFPRVIVDGLGHRLTIDHPPSRIVSLSPSATELLFSLGLGDRVVGVTAYCDYPPQARRRPKVGDMTLNLEVIASLRPDLLVCEGSLNSGVVERVSSLGVPVLCLFSPDIAHLEQSVLLLGRATGQDSQARKALASFQARVGAVDKQVAALKGSRPVVFIDISPSPLMTAGKGTFMDELVERAGGSNLAQDLGKGYFQLSLETILMRDPQVIMLTEGSVKEVYQQSLWRGMRAVKSRRVYRVDPDILVRPGLRLAEGLEVLFRIFHEPGGRE